MEAELGILSSTASHTPASFSEVGQEMGASSFSPLSLNPSTQRLLQAASAWRLRSLNRGHGHEAPRRGIPNTHLEPFIHPHSWGSAADNNSQLWQGQAWLQSKQNSISSPTEILASSAESISGGKIHTQRIQVSRSLILLTVLWLN